MGERAVKTEAEVREKRRYYTASLKGERKISRRMQPLEAGQD